MKCIIQLLSLVSLSLFSATVMAGTMCSPDGVKLESVQLADGDPSNPNIIDAVSPINASDCLLLLGNDQPLPSGSNIGTYKDGLLNGEVWHDNDGGGGNIDLGLSPDNIYFDPFAPDSELKFITPEDLQDLDGVGGLNDPGWIYLGKDNGDGFGYGVEVGKDVDGGVEVTPFIDGEGLVNINFNCLDSISLGNNCSVGEWSIEPNPDIVEDLTELLGDGFFDHLAFVIKTGNVCHPVDDPHLLEPGTDTNSDNNECRDNLEGPQFAIYDFNFRDIFKNLGLDDDGVIDALQSPYNLGGTFNVSDIFHNKQVISHISVWVRDPSYAIEVPEPRASLLLLLGLIMIVARFRSNRGML